MHTFTSATRHIAFLRVRSTMPYVVVVVFLAAFAPSQVRLRLGLRCKKANVKPQLDAFAQACLTTILGIRFPFISFPQLFFIAAAPMCSNHTCQTANNVLIVAASNTSCGSVTCSDAVCCQAGVCRLHFICS